MHATGQALSPPGLYAGSGHRVLADTLARFGLRALATGSPSVIICCELARLLPSIGWAGGCVQCVPAAPTADGLWACSMLIDGCLPAGISRDSLHKRRLTGGKQPAWRKKRK